MGIWSEIKYALNSTLGTSAFKPLNEVLADTVMGGKKFIPSDTDVQLSRSFGFKEEKTYTFLKLKPNISGTVKLRYTTDDNPSYNAYYQIDIYKNGSLYYTWKASPPDSSTSTFTSTSYLSFTAGDILEFQAYTEDDGTGTTTESALFEILATVQDSNYLEVI